MEWLWADGGGGALFDPYSLHHLVWFFAITVALAAMRLRRLWPWVFGIAALWELAESWIVDNLPGFPFVGREGLINKMVGDPISDLAGFALGLLAVRAVRAMMTHIDQFQQTLERAKRLAAKVHAGQRYGEFPYTRHLFDTMDVLGKFGFFWGDADPERRERARRLVLAAVLHDTLEDTDLTYDLVFAVTNEPGPNRRERFRKTYPKIRAHPDATVLKLADRIANVIHALQSNPDILAMYRREWPVFERELRRPGECDPMWAYLESILMPTGSVGQ